MSFISKRIGTSLTALVLLSSSALAQDATSGDAPAEPASPAGSLSLELNSLQPSDGGCRVTFVVENGLGNDLSGAAFELVLFDADGKVDRITVVDFQDLPASRTKVRQFDFKGIECDGIGRVLVNDATKCAGDGIEPNACIRDLEASTKASIPFGS